MKSKTNPLLNTKCPRIGYYELVIFSFLFLEFIFMTSEKILDSFVATHYLITYEFGLIPRGFVGSIVSLFTNHVTKHLIFMIGEIFFTVLIVQISLLLGYAIRSSDSTVRPATIIFTVLFMASPLSVTYLLGAYFARLDTYWIIITLFALVLLKNPALRFTVPLLCAIAIMIHQGYMVTYMPALAIPMLYEVYKSKYSKKVIAIFSLSCLIMIILFLFLQLSQKNIPYDNAVDFSNHLSENAGYKADPFMIYLEYYAPFPNWIIELIIPLVSSIALPIGLIMLVFSSPLLIIFGYIWKQSISGADNKFLKFIFILCLAAPLVFIPAALFGTDWDRWWAAVMNNQFILVFYLIYSNEAVVISFVKKIGDFFNKHFLLLLLIIIFTNSLTFSKTTTLVYSTLIGNKSVFGFMYNYLFEKVYGTLIRR